MVAMCCDQGGWTALMWAARYGHTETAQALIALGADIEAKNKVSTHTPMICHDNDME